MARITVRHSGRSAVTRLQKMEAQVGDAVFDGLLKSTQLLVGEIRRQIQAWVNTSGFRGRRTGALSRSYRPSVEKRADGTISAGAFSDLVYAWIHEVGGPIVAKRGKNLAIPFPDVPLGLQPRNRTDLQFAISRKGNKLLVERSTGRPQYLLRPSVNIRPKKYLTKAADRATPRIETLIARAIERKIAT